MGIYSIKYFLSPQNSSWGSESQGRLGACPAVRVDYRRPVALRVDDVGHARVAVRDLPAVRRNRGRVGRGRPRRGGRGVVAEPHEEVVPCAHAQQLVDTNDRAYSRTVWCTTDPTMCAHIAECQRACRVHTGRQIADEGVVCAEVQPREVHDAAVHAEVSTDGVRGQIVVA